MDWREIMSGEGDVMMMMIFTCSKNILSFLSLSHCIPEEAVTVRLVLTALLQDSILLLSSPAFYTGGAAIEVFSTLYIVNPSMSRYQQYI